MSEHEFTACRGCGAKFALDIATQCPCCDRYYIPPNKRGELNVPDDWVMACWDWFGKKEAYIGPKDKSPRPLDTATVVTP